MRNLGEMFSTESLRAFLQADQAAALELLREMVGINSFTDNPDGVNRLGRLTAECFAPLGFQAESVPCTTPARGDHLVLTRAGRSHLALAIVSHLDTVFPPEEEERNQFRWRVDGDRIYGPGTNDIKGGTVLIWMILRALQAVDPATFEAVEWRLFWNSSEEALGDDFGQLVRSRLDSGTVAALVFEGESRSKEDHLLVVSRKGRATWRVIVSGRGAHAGASHRQGANAIAQMGRVIERLHALTDYERGLTFNVGAVRGGTVLNRVPHEAIVEGEFRAFDPEVFGAARHALQSLAGPGEVRSPADGHPCQVRVEFVSESRPWPHNPATDRLFGLWQATADRLGIRAQPEARGGLSDGNALWDVVPTLDGLGPWGENAHCSEWSADGSKLPEYVSASSFVPKAVWNALAIQELVRQGRR